MTVKYLFSNELAVKDRVRVTSEALACLPATPNLQRASLQNAVLFGGPAVRECLENAPIVGDRKHVFVDTKVSLLLPGFIPAIPGWHTDGVPRRATDPASVDPFSPFNPGNPSLDMQRQMHKSGYFPRFHTVHIGNHCPTEFVTTELNYWLEHAEDSGLYRELTEQTNRYIGMGKRPGVTPVDITTATHGCWHSWDWWQIHRARPADQRGWRLLIRVTESSEPPLDSQFIRSQTQIYIGDGEFGW